MPPGPPPTSRPSTNPVPTEQPALDFRTFVPAETVRERGRALRAAVPPSTLGAGLFAGPRPTVVDFVNRSNMGRLPHLIPLRIDRMAASPFSFYRGAAAIMAHDLAATTVTGLTAQVCGDAHAANFGLYGTRDGRIIMDINDFDETVVGPWEWDLARLATSLVLAGREGGVNADRCLEAAEDSAKSYRRTMRELADLPFMESWNALPDQSILSDSKAGDLMKDFDDAARKAERNTSARVAAKWTVHLENHTTGVVEQRFVDNPPVLTHVDAAVADAVINALPEYVASLRESRRELIARFAVSDVAFRIVGTGSVGLRSYVVLLRGNDSEVLILQFKQARPSALAPYVGGSPAAHEGRRIVEGARNAQTDTDILLGWTTVDGFPFIVRQFRNLKGDIDPTTLSGRHLDDYGRLAGALLARSHARSLDPRLLAGYFDGDSDLDETFGRVAVAYADRAEADHAELLVAIADGRLYAAATANPAENEG